MSTDSTCQLCVTHSPLVTRVFEAAMRLRGIPMENTRSIARRGVPFQGNGICLDDVSDALERCFKKFDRKGYMDARKQFEQSLLELTGGQPFEAYIPHANKILYQEIIRHRLCANYSFLEEGFTSMLWNQWRNMRSSFSKNLRNHLRSWRIRPNYRFNRPMFDHDSPKYRAAYCISGLAFHDMPGRTDVSAYLPPQTSGNPPGNTYVILDAAYIHDGIRWQDYENALVEAIREHAISGGELRVKFHFADSKAPQHFELIRQRLMNSGMPEPRLLEPGFSVEDHLTSEDLMLFAVTSLGYYVALAGGRVRCFAGNIIGIRLESWMSSGRLPVDFARIVGLDPS